METEAYTLKGVVQYDGTRYHGFQRQSHGRPTVQAVLEQAIASLTGESVAIAGAGRTDAGVHAHGQVIHFATKARIPVDRWPAALNTRLPHDVAMVAVEQVEDDFHARLHARWKTYRYTFWNGSTPSPFWRPFSWWVRRPLDVQAMSFAAASLLGRRDFAAFAASGGAVRSTVRTLLRLDVEEERVGPGQDRLVHVWAAADGFLYKMVRNIVGTLVPVGLGEKDPRWVETVLDGRDRRLAGPTAPPQGLTLWEVVYDEPAMPGSVGARGPTHHRSPRDLVP